MSQLRPDYKIPLVPRRGNSTSQECPNQTIGNEETRPKSGDKQQPEASGDKQPPEQSEKSIEAGREIGFHMELFKSYSKEKRLATRAILVGKIHDVLTRREVELPECWRRMLGVVLNIENTTQAACDSGREALKNIQAEMRDANLVVPAWPERLVSDLIKYQRLADLRQRQQQTSNRQQQQTSSRQQPYQRQGTQYGPQATRSVSAKRPASTVLFPPRPPGPNFVERLVNHQDELNAMSEQYSSRRPVTPPLPPSERTVSQLSLAITVPSDTRYTPPVSATTNMVQQLNLSYLEELDKFNRYAKAFFLSPFVSETEKVSKHRTIMEWSASFMKWTCRANPETAELAEALSTTHHHSHPPTATHNNSAATFNPPRDQIMVVTMNGPPKQSSKSKPASTASTSRTVFAEPTKAAIAKPVRTKADQVAAQREEQRKQMKELKEVRKQVEDTKRQLEQDEEEMDASLTINQESDLESSEKEDDKEKELDYEED